MDEKISAICAEYEMPLVEHLCVLVKRESMWRNPYREFLEQNAGTPPLLESVIPFDQRVLFCSYRGLPLASMDDRSGKGALAPYERLAAEISLRPERDIAVEKTPAALQFKQAIQESAQKESEQGSEDANVRTTITQTDEGQTL